MMRVSMSNDEFPPIGGGAGQAYLNLLRRLANNPEVTVDVVTKRLHRLPLLVWLLKRIPFESLPLFMQTNLYIIARKTDAGSS